MASSSDSFYSANSDTSDANVTSHPAAPPLSRQPQSLPPPPASAPPSTSPPAASRAPSSPPLALPRRHNSRAAHAVPASAPAHTAASATRSPTRWSNFFSSGGGGGDAVPSPARSRRGRGGDAAAQRAVAVAVAGGEEEEEEEEEDADDWGADFDSDGGGDGGFAEGVGDAAAVDYFSAPPGGGFRSDPFPALDGSALGRDGIAGPGSGPSAATTLFSFGSQGEGLRRGGAVGGKSNLRHVLSSGDVAGAMKGDASFRLRAPNVSDGREEEGEVGAAVIGIYADPTAEKDDWAADFQLEPGRAGAAKRGANGEGDGTEPQSAVLDLLRGQARDRARAKGRAGVAARASAPAQAASPLPGTAGFRRKGRTSPRQANSFALGPGAGGGFSFEKSGDGGDGPQSILGDADAELEDVASVSLTVPSEHSMGLALRGQGSGPRNVRSAFDRLKRAPEKIRTSPRAALPDSEAEMVEVDTACRRFLDLCTRHLIAIETHLEGLREDRKSMLALEGAGESVYSFTSDQDVTKLTSASSAARLEVPVGHSPGHRTGYTSDVEASESFGPAESEEQFAAATALGAAARDILLWKLEYARLTGNVLGSIGPLIGLARYEREQGVVKNSFECLDEARSLVDNIRSADLGADSQRLLDTLRIEMQYESAMAHRRSGDLENAAKIFSTAADMSMALAAREDTSDMGSGSEQRGLWWALESKYMLGESLYDEKRYAAAVQQYIEYAMQALARMIGLIVPSHPDQATVGSSLMRYCLFSPRRLALSVWSAALCLAELGLVEASANVGSMAMRVATALGVEDIRVATVEFCGRVKDSLRELKRRQISVNDPNGAPASLDGGNRQAFGDTPGTDGWESGTGPASLLRDLDAELAADDLVGMEEDWDTQIAREMHITIQRCSEATGPGAALFANEGAAGNVGGLSPGGTAGVMNGHFGEAGSLHVKGALMEGASSDGVPGETVGMPAEGIGGSGGHARSGSSPGGASGTGRLAENSASNVLTESELRQYLNSLNSSTANISSQQRMYPKPTQPFQASARGPQEHEALLREFVRCRTAPGSRKLRERRFRFSGIKQADATAKFVAQTVNAEHVSDIEGTSAPPSRTASGVSDMSAYSTATSALGVFDAVRDCEMRLRGTNRGSSTFAIIHQESAWALLRSRGSAANKREQVRILVNSAFSDIGSFATPSSARGMGQLSADNDAVTDRMSAVSSLLELLRLAREVLDPGGADAGWFTEATEALVSIAATLTPAFKAAIELFRAESRAHCGIVTVTLPEILELCRVVVDLVPPSNQYVRSDASVVSPGDEHSSSSGVILVPRPRGARSRLASMAAKSPARKLSDQTPTLVSAEISPSELTLPSRASRPSAVPSVKRDSRVPAALQISVVDVLHSLYWRTKAGIDESSSRADAVECLVHADVSASLYLVGVGVSPVTGESLDIAKDEAVLNLDHVPVGLVDDTRRVSGPDLVHELEAIWEKLPETAGEVRARVCLALAHHMQVDLRDLAYAERLVFDALLGIHNTTPEDGNAEMIRPTLCVSAHASPLAVVSSPLCGALLYEYGTIALRRSKYRYGIAALEAAVDGRKIRDPNKSASLASAHEVAAIALSKYDWRRALSWLFDLRNSVQPINGRRNDFVRLCLLMHEICVDAGCFGAALIPLRAYSALLYEERLRVLLERYRDRLAKKARSRRRYDAATSLLPSMLGRAKSVSLGGNRSSTLALFFDRAHSRASSARYSAPDGAANVDNGTGNPRFGMAERRSSDIVPARDTQPTSSWSAKAAKFVFRYSSRAHLRKTVSAASNIALSSSMQTGQSAAAKSGSAEAMSPERSSGAGGHSGSDWNGGALDHAAQYQNDAPTQSVSGTSLLTDGSDGHGTNFEYEREELFTIAEEQLAFADAGSFEVEFLKAKLAYDGGQYVLADNLCKVLLDLVPRLRGHRYFVLEIMARVRLKRREITRCLEYVEQMEQEAADCSPGAFSRDHSKLSSFGTRSNVVGSLGQMNLSRKGTQDAEQSAAFSGHHGSGKTGSDALRGVRGSGKDDGQFGSNFSRLGFLPESTFLRLSALFHGGRLSEALSFADETLELCPEEYLWYRAKLHYMRGRTLFAMCSDATAPFEGEEVANSASLPVESVMDSRYAELTLLAFETSSSYFDAAGDEVGMVKSDLRWAQTAIDVLFRRVVVSREEGDTPVPLAEACRLKGRSIVFSDLQDVVHSTLSFLSAANLPLLTIEALAALAEVKCIEGDPSVTWSFWVAEAWKLFSRLLADPEEYRVVLTDIAPVSTLMRLKNLCGRLVRLVLCSTHVADVESINKHLGMFEAYVTLQVDIDRRMNLASGAHGRDADLVPSKSDGGDAGETKSGEARPVGGASELQESRAGAQHALGDGHTSTSKKGSRVSGGSISSGGDHENKAAKDAHRPAGAFLHVFGDEGVALGREGFEVFVSRPRQQFVNVVKESGAVLVPRSILPFSGRRTKETATMRAYQRDQDAEYIFPFNEKIGLGAMYILDSASFEEVVSSQESSIGSSPDSPDGMAVEVEGQVAPHPDDHHAKSGAKVSGPNHSGVAGGVALQKSSARTHALGDRDTFSKPVAGEESDARGGSHEADLGGALRGTDVRTGSNALSALVDAIRGVYDGSRKEYACLGDSIAERVWAHFHRIKTETSRYSRGEITVEELGQRNGGTLRSWLRCVPRSRREWSVPEALGKRLVYILYAHGVVGYYSVDRGSCVSRLEFGGKQSTRNANAAGPAQSSGPGFSSAGSPTDWSQITGLTAVSARDLPARPPNDAERKFIYGLVKDWKAKGTTWYKDRESEIINGLATAVLRTPRILLETRQSVARSKTQKNRPIVLIVDLTLQVFPWELFLDHVVIRSLSLLDSIRGLQDNAFKRQNQLALQEAMVSPTVALSRRIVRFVNFASPRREGGDLERSEEARRQQLAFQSLLRLNHLSPPRLIACLELGGFSDPTALNAVARPTGPLSTPLTQSKKAVNLLGVRIEAPVGRRNYSQLDFVKVPGLGSASTMDLKEAALVPVQEKKKRGERNGSGGGIRKEVGAYIAVFLFTYADLVDVTESVFGLLRSMPRGILIFAPATKMKVVVRHLEDEELDAELHQASGRRGGRIVPDIGASARVIVEYVSRFARSKLIPIVVFLGEGLVEVWPQKRAREISGAGSGSGAAQSAVGGGVGGYTGGGVGGVGGVAASSNRILSGGGGSGKRKS